MLHTDYVLKKIFCRINEQQGGDVIRDGASILPTGRNIYALDPYRVPSTLAMIRGKEAVEQILAGHRKANAGSFPETVAVTLWVYMCGC